MGFEAPSNQNQTESQDSQELLKVQMVRQWEQANGRVFSEAVADAKTMEDVIAALKTCGIKELRKYDTGQKVVMHEHGSFHSVDEIVRYIPQYAEALRNNDSNTLYAMSDVGIPDLVKERLKEIVTTDRK